MERRGTGTRTMEKFVVAYAKIQTDKDEITLQGVFFGGLGDDPEEAEQIARDCVNTTKGGTILPKVVKVTSKHAVMDAMFDAFEKFEQVVTYMVESNNTIRRTTKKR